MAIVINGSGTVTGISVGGLPDGIVDSGTIGADAVTAAKIGDDVIDSEHYAAGSIDTAHIAADQITSAILPAGSVLQVLQAGYDSSSATTVSANTFTTLITQSITIQADSKLLCFYNSAQTDESGANVNPDVRVRIDGSSIITSTNHYFYGVDSRVVINCFALSGTLTAGAREVTVQGGSYGGATIYNYQAGNLGRLIVMEIAG